MTEPLARPTGEVGGDPIAVVLGEVGHAFAFREVLAEEAVSVLVGAAFPGMVRRREVEPRGYLLLEGRVAVELGP